MKKTGFLYDNRYLLHDTGSFHPEIPERLQAVYKGIKDAGLLPHLMMINAVAADIKWIESVHQVEYIRRFEELCYAGAKTIDYPDNQMCQDTYETALLAVGGILHTIDLMMNGEIDNAFCAVRPPGHHAEANQAMGFCYFNNVAIAAKYLHKKWKINKIGIVDFDVHHGNGTQKIFENDPWIFYYSMHEHPSFAFPGTGRVFEKGSNDGEGYTRNYPILPGQGDNEYKKLVEEDMVPTFENFKPEVFLVSTGFDAHVDDDMSGVNLTTDGFSWLMKKILKIANIHAKGRIISVLEGGYCLKRLPELAKNHVEILLNG